MKKKLNGLLNIYKTTHAVVIARSCTSLPLGLSLWIRALSLGIKRSSRSNLLRSKFYGQVASLFRQYTLRGRTLQLVIHFMVNAIKLHSKMNAGISIIIKY